MMDDKYFVYIFLTMGLFLIGVFMLGAVPSP